MKSLAAAVAVLIILLAGIASERYLHGLTLVVRAGNLHGPVRGLADLDTVRITEHLVSVRIKDLVMRARVYTPAAGRPRQTVLLVSGLHPAGLNEPRLAALARTLAETNVTVVTPEIRELSRFDITPVLTDRIEAVAVWLAVESGLAPSGRIGLMGMSFSGGLAIAAAARPSLRHHLLYVLSLGGHDDLRRVLRYLCTGRDGLPPHDYGVAIVLLNVADHLVPPDQVASLREAVRRFLWASYLERVDSERSRQEFTALRDLARTLPEPSATLLDYVNRRDVAHLGPLLLPSIDSHASAPALSPSQSPHPAAPIFLLHGRDDTVIPADESRRLAEHARDGVAVRLLITAVISHADADQPPHVADVIRLAGFWGDLLGR
jgi:dienelactone hydrolase